MAKFKLAPFEQARLLTKDEPGVCVALCDFWLHAFLKRNLDCDPHLRMRVLALSIDEAWAHQAMYGALRDQVGPQDARAVAGQKVGIDYDAQTAVFKVYLGQNGMQAKLAADLTNIGSAATWSMRFPDGGHAIAGVHRLESLTENYHQSVFRIFDPNIGEYYGPKDILGGMLTDLFTRIPDYAATEHIRRTRAMRV